jgi:hypothetical protein
MSRFVAQCFGKPNNRGQWSAELVRDSGQELVLGCAHGLFSGDVGCSAEPALASARRHKKPQDANQGHEEGDNESDRVGDLTDARANGRDIALSCITFGNQQVDSSIRCIPERFRIAALRRFDCTRFQVVQQTRSRSRVVVEGELQSPVSEDLLEARDLGAEVP